jgi:hypothetical protein
LRASLAQPETGVAQRVRIRQPGFPSTNRATEARAPSGIIAVRVRSFVYTIGGVGFCEENAGVFRLSGK